MYPPPLGSKFRENMELCVTWSLGSVSLFLWDATQLQRG